MTTNTSPHIPYIKECLSLAEKSPQDPPTSESAQFYYPAKTTTPPSQTTGSSRRGNTHAEQCCFANYAAVHKVADDKVGEVLPVEPGRKLVMYVTMEPCGKRLSGNAPCVQRITQTREGGREGVHKVYFGVKEPGTFVGESEGCQMLTQAGIEWEHVGGLEKEILTVAFAGHDNAREEVRAALGEKETNVDDISAEERKRQEALPRNPLKRMMEGDKHIYL
ncbi:CMP/dCMP deaminase zinc-binding [Penicillium psychrosexuale]|uniref:CMP/dCMP deaminase zinc-binding n=1 Tax=Penicillium psychrosexuale TaxID=1002107 RepID=UPI0025452CB4|nr:CMP/dCMP deaminase zinc-binding [Penicillium psychrosexuale]KAJ5796464.1 CMP/dCMP deaminase zinc-binding [Penicillium psychrosexuale]